MEEEQMESFRQSVDTLGKGIEKLAGAMKELMDMFRPYLNWYWIGEKKRVKEESIKKVQHNQVCPFCKKYNENPVPCFKCSRVNTATLLEAESLEDHFEYNENWKEQQEVK